MTNSSVMGKYVESMVASYLAYENEDVRFWRSPQKDEVDVVIGGRDIQPIEVKYRSEVPSSELRPLLKFMRAYDLKRATAVTKDILDLRLVNGQEIVLVPAWVFMLFV